MLDLVCLGELLIDFTPAGKSEQGNELFECNPGGGPANFVVAAGRLGAKIGFIGQVGHDHFGQYLKQTLEGYHVDTTGLILSNDYMTTLAFVHLFEDGDRDFTFYRKNGADAFLRKEDVAYDVLDRTKVLHFSSLTLVNEIGTESTFAAVHYAKEKGVMVSYDPNWRPSLWDNDEHCRTSMASGLTYADVVKVSEEELLYLTEQNDANAAAELILSKGPKLVIETCGEKGMRYYHANGCGSSPGFAVQAIDATGAGDASFGSVMYGILQRGIDLNHIDNAVLEEILRFANATAAISVTRRGAMPSLPDTQEVKAFLSEHSA